MTLRRVHIVADLFYALRSNGLGCYIAAMKCLLSVLLLPAVFATAQTKLPPPPIPLTAEETARPMATGELPKHGVAPVNGRLTAYRFRNAPLFTLTDYFTELTGVRVEGARNFVAEITLNSAEKVTVPEFLAVFSNELKRLDITLEPVTTGVVRVRDAHTRKSFTTGVARVRDTHEWKPAPDTNTAYAQRRQQRLAAMSENTSQPPAPQDTCEALKNHQEGHALRPGIQSRPAPLTPEQDAELVRQGIMPPRADGGTNAPAKAPMTGKP